MSDAPLITIKAWSLARGVTPRQGQVYRSQGRLPGAVQTATGWLVPADAEPLPPGDVAATSSDIAPRATHADIVATSPDVVTMSRALPPGLWRLPVVARWWDTDVPAIERMGAAGLLTIGPYGRRGATRVYVPEK